jgi:hypothetical protein
MADMKQDVIHLMNERFSHINSSDLEKIHQAMEKKADIKDLIIQKRQMVKMS